MTDDEIESSVRIVRAATELVSGPPIAFAHDLQIRDSDRGLGLVWATDGECWAIPPDPFYTKDFLSRLKTMCNRYRRAKAEEK